MESAATKFRAPKNETSQASQIGEVHQSVVTYIGVGKIEKPQVAQPLQVTQPLV